MSEVKRYYVNLDHGTRYVAVTGCDQAMYKAEDFDRVTAERDAAIGREAALKVSLGISANLSELYVEGIESIRAERNALQQRLTAADDLLRDLSIICPGQIGCGDFSRERRTWADLDEYVSFTNCALKQAEPHPCPVYLDGCDGSCAS